LSGSFQTAALGAVLHYFIGVTEKCIARMISIVNGEIMYKNCVRCGERYVGTGSSKYCLICKVNVLQEHEALMAKRSHERRKHALGNIQCAS